MDLDCFSHSHDSKKEIYIPPNPHTLFTGDLIQDPHGCLKTAGDAMTYASVIFTWTFVKLCSQTLTATNDEMECKHVFLPQ